jgi:hypothetical protein
VHFSKSKHTREREREREILTKAQLCSPFPAFSLKPGISLPFNMMGKYLLILQNPAEMPTL